MMEYPAKEGEQSLSHLARDLWAILSDGIKEQKKRLALALVFTLLAISTTLAATYTLQHMIDNVLPRQDAMLLLTYAGLLVLAYLAGLLFWFVQIRFSVRASELIFYALRRKLVTRILNKPIVFYGRYLSGDLSTRLHNDLEFISEFFYQNLFRSLSFCLSSFVIIIVLLAWNWQLGLAALATIPVLLLYILKTHRPISARAGVTRAELTNQEYVLQDLLEGIKELRFFQQEKQGFNRFEAVTRTYTDTMIRSVGFSDRARVGIEFVGVLITLLPFVVGGLLISMGNPQVTIGVLVAYFQLLTILTGQVQFIFAGMTRLAQLLPGLQRLKEIIDYPEDQVIEARDLCDIPDSTAIQFKDVHFAYVTGRDVISGFNLTVSPGENVALMGSSGSGKTTIANLLVRFLRPTQGEILFGGRNIQEYSYPLYLSFFSYVSQQTHHFGQSVADNIAMGWYHVPLDRIKEVASLVRMHDFIEGLPDKYATVLGENGVNLSTGQRQRLALARALIRDPEVLVLDEFTSSLDQEVEQEILSDLFRLFDKQTIICITHSPSVAERFDRVVRLSSQPAAGILLGRDGLPNAD